MGNEMSKQRGRTNRKSRNWMGRKPVRKRVRASRNLYTERLEDRRLLSADLFPWHNGLIPTDVTGDYRTTPRDALAIINYLNEHGSGTLDPSASPNSTSGSWFDTKPDNRLSPGDALVVINQLNKGEGQENDIVAYYVDALDMNGDSLANRANPYQVKVGEDFQIQVSVQDLRASLQASGVFAGYLDVGYSLPQGDSRDPGELFTIVYGETQRISLDPRTAINNGTFTLTFNGETTAPIPLGTGPEIQSALEALPSIEPGDVVLRERFVRSEDGTTISQIRWDVLFSGQYRRMDMPPLSGNFDNLNLTSGTNRQDTIDVQYPARITNPGTFGSSFIASSDYPNGVTAYPPSWPADSAFGVTADPDGIDGDSLPDEFDEIGAFSKLLGSPPNPNDVFPLIKVAVTADAAGVINFAGNIAELLGNATESGASDTLVFGSNIPVAAGLIDFAAANVMVTIIQPVNAIDDSFSVGEDQPTNLDVLANDFLARDQNLKPVLDSITQAPAHGTAVIANGLITYTPGANFFGQDKFRYQAVDGVDSDTAEVIVNVTPVNDPPSAVDDTATMAEDSGSIDINVIANDSPGPGETAIDSLTIQPVTLPNQSGTAAVINNQIHYTPAANFFGNETFNYTVVDQGGLTATAMVTVTVTPVNDAPIAVDDSGQMNEDGSSIDIDVLANDSPGPLESSIDSISIQSVGAPNKGGSVSVIGGVVRYTPAANFFGDETFDYTIVDQGELTDVGSVTITVNPVNDAPIANDDNLFVDEMTADNQLLVLANDSPGPMESGIDSITISAVTVPNNGGTATISADQLSVLYSPDATLLGPYTETFTYTITDTGGLSDTATVTVNVEPVVRPRARDDQFNAQEDSLFADNTFDVMANDLFNDGATSRSLSVTAAGLAAPQHGQVQVVDQNGTPVVQYQPIADFFGTDTFEYQIDDNFVGADGPSVPDIGMVTVTVSNVNDTPIPTDDNFDNIQEDSTNNVLDVLANDKAGPPNETEAIHVAAVTAASHGSVVIGTGGANVLYTPDANYFGGDTFTYTVSDGSLEAVATVTLTVLNVNDPPVAVTDNFPGVLEDTPTLLDVLANDTAGPANELESISVIGVTQPAHGTVAIGANGANVEYTPDANYFGADSFTYTIQDAGNPPLTDSTTVTLTVNDVNDPPQANPDTGADSPLALKNFVDQTLDVLANDSIAPDVGEELTIVGLGQVNDPQATDTQITTPHGTAHIAADGKSIIYTPNTDYQGIDSFRYRISDGRGGIAETMVDVDVVDAVPSNISGTAYLDVNNNGVRDIDPVTGQYVELALAGVQVTLTGTDVRGNAVDRTVSTDTNGIFLFDSVLPNAVEDAVGYQIVAQTPEFMVDGQDRINDTTVADDLNPGVLSNDRVDNLKLGLFGTTRAENNYMFGERGLTSKYLSIAGYLASSHEGLAVATNMAGDDYWFSIMQGWDGIQSAHVQLADDLTSATLTIVDSNGQQHAPKTIGYRDYRLGGDAETGEFVIYFNGSAKDLGFNLPGEGELGAAEVPPEGECPIDVEQVERSMGGDAEQYAQAVDAIFGSEGMA